MRVFLYVHAKDGPVYVGPFINDFLANRFLTDYGLTPRSQKAEIVDPEIFVKERGLQRV